LTESFWETSGVVRLARVGDWAGMVNHVEDLLRRPDERRRLGGAGQAFYDRMFDLRRTVAALRTAA
jgi:hypothetical protein